jgi:hypothetical protein
MSPRLRPFIAMGQIYPAGSVYAPRANAAASRWMPNDAALLDALTGNQLCIAGTMPVVCSGGVQCDATLALLEEAGLEIATHRHVYDDAACAAGLALRAAGEYAGRLVIQHAHPDDVLPPARQWIDPALLRYLNNKANLAELAPPAHVPPRRVVAREAFFASPAPALPVVLKAVTDESTGGGGAVRVCRSLEDISAARDFFSPCTHVVVESFLRIARNLCLHFAVMPEGRTVYLGFAEQDVTDAGRYRGNWMEISAALDRAIVDAAMPVVERAGELGYRGVAGIDVAITDQGRIYVVDLNFRVNGSTHAVLLAPALLEAFGPAMLHMRSFRCAAGIEPMIAAIRRVRREHAIVPTMLFDPAPAGYRDPEARCGAMVLGSSRDEILAIEAELARHGLS